MRRAFALTLLLLAVVAAILLLGERAPRSPTTAAAAPAAAPTADTPKLPRMVALRRMLPRYTLTLSASEPRIEETVQRLAEQHGATLSGQTANGFQLALPHAKFKPFLRALRGDADAGRGRHVGLVAAGESPQRGAVAQIEVSLRWSRP